MKLLGVKTNLLLTGFIFLFLYLPVMGRPYNFEELRFTKHFYTVPDRDESTFSVLSREKVSSKWDLHKADFLRLYPPLQIGFYFLWSKITFEDEYLMRLPLLLLIFLCFKELFTFFTLYVQKDEASLTLIISSLFPWWYTYGSSITPNSFGLFLSFLSLLKFYPIISKEKEIPRSLWITNIIGLFVLYQFSLLIFMEVLFLAFSKKSKMTLRFILFHSLLLVSLWATYFSFPNPYFANPLVFYWNHSGIMEIWYLIKTFLSGGLHA